MNTTRKTQRLTGLALFTAIIVVLQIVATFVRFGPFSVTLTMIPIVVGAAIYGPKAGAYLGGVFGVVVFIACIAGWDLGGNVLFTANPALTGLLCIVKGAAAGLVAGGIYAALGKKSATGGAIVAAIAGPVVNTGIFILGMVFFFRETLIAWAGGTEVVYYVITGLVGVNFLLELLVNLVLSPVIVRISSAVGARRAIKRTA